MAKLHFTGFEQCRAICCTLGVDKYMGTIHPCHPYTLSSLVCITFRLLAYNGLMRCSSSVVNPVVAMALLLLSFLQRY